MIFTRLGDSRCCRSRWGSIPVLGSGGSGGSCSLSLSSRGLSFLCSAFWRFIIFAHCVSTEFGLYLCVWLYIEVSFSFLWCDRSRDRFYRCGHTTLFSQGRTQLLGLCVTVVGRIYLADFQALFFLSNAFSVGKPVPVEELKQLFKHTCGTIGVSKGCRPICTKLLSFHMSAHSSSPTQLYTGDPQPLTIPLSHQNIYPTSLPARYRRTRFD